MKIQDFLNIGSCTAKTTYLSVTIYQLTRRHITESLNLCPYRWDNLKSRSLTNMCCYKFQTNLV